MKVSYKQFFRVNFALQVNGEVEFCKDFMNTKREEVF